MIWDQHHNVNQEKSRPRLVLSTTLITTYFPSYGTALTQTTAYFLINETVVLHITNCCPWDLMISITTYFCYTWDCSLVNYNKFSCIWDCDAIHYMFSHIWDCSLINYNKFSCIWDWEGLKDVWRSCEEGGHFAWGEVCILQTHTLCSMSVRCRHGFRLRGARQALHASPSPSRKLVGLLALKFAF